MGPHPEGDTPMGPHPDSPTSLHRSYAERLKGFSSSRDITQEEGLLIQQTMHALGDSVPLMGRPTPAGHPPAEELERQLKEELEGLADEVTPRRDPALPTHPIHHPPISPSGSSASFCRCDKAATSICTTRRSDPHPLGSPLAGAPP